MTGHILLHQMLLQEIILKQFPDHILNVIVGTNQYLNLLLLYKLFKKGGNVVYTHACDVSILLYSLYRMTWTV